MSLNPEQRAAVEADESVVVVRAGAGSGKTRTLLARAERLARRGQRVRLFAFTRVAAAEMRQRLAPELADRIEISTLHAHAAAVCGRHLHRRDGFREGWSILTEADDQRIIKEAKASGERPERIRRTHGLVTYDELLDFGIGCLQLSGAEAETGGAVLLDEAQDLTAREWEYVSLLSPSSLTVVGDPAQAIYGWRGGLADVLAGPGAAQHPTPRWLLAGARWLDLPTNYRSRPEILALANRLEIPGRVELAAARTAGGRVVVEATPTDDALVEQLTGWGSPLWSAPGEWAVICRTRGRLLPLLEQLVEAGIPVSAPALEGKVWEESEPARELVDLLHVVAHPHDSLHLARVLARAGMSRPQLLRAEADRAGLYACSLWQWACAHLVGGRPAHRALVTMADARRQGTAAGAARLLTEQGLARPGAPLADIPEELDPAGFLAWLSSPDREPARRAEGAVELATIHGAKGREWRRVVVLGLEEGHFPSPRSELVEERRLAYVAVTRAMDELVLHRSDNRPGWRGGVMSSEPSRFCAELGLG